MEIYGADIYGIDGQLIRFSTVQEANAGGIRVLGLAGKVVREGIERATKAIETLPGKWNILGDNGYTFDLEPAETPKHSSGLDLPIAIMLLQASILDKHDSINKERQVLTLELDKVAASPAARDKVLQQLETLIAREKIIQKYRKRLQENSASYLLIGKLDIVSGAIITPHVGMFGMISAARPGFKIIIPHSSETHGALISKANRGITVWTAKSLKDVWETLIGIKPPYIAVYDQESIKEKDPVGYRPDFKAISGVVRAKWAMEVALAGGHNVLMVGPPGQGKTMLARASSALLPPMTQAEMFEVNKIYSARGELNENEVVVNRPFQSVHSSVTEAALFGGGVPPRPGLVSLAHQGILLFDEINLCKASLIDKLRDPLSNRQIGVQRLAGSVEYPCGFILVAAMNPCKCGWFGHFRCPECSITVVGNATQCESHPEAFMVSKCKCSPKDIRTYRDRLSKPILDRIDLKVFVSEHDKSFFGKELTSSSVKQQIGLARKRQAKRYQNSHINCNADVPDLSQFEEISHKTSRAYKNYCSELDLTKRLEVKMLLVARTVADLAGAEEIETDHLRQAVDLMGLKNEYFIS